MILHFRQLELGQLSLKVLVLFSPCSIEIIVHMPQRKYDIINTTDGQTTSRKNRTYFRPSAFGEGDVASG